MYFLSWYFVACDKKATKFGVQCSFTKFLAQNSDIKDALKKFSLFFRQAKIIFVIVWFLDHFTLKYVPSINNIWVITSAGLLRAWVTNFKTIFIFFKLSILTANNLIWVNFSAILFKKVQHVVKISTTGYVPVFYEVINLFIKSQNFLLMFFICKLKGLYLIIFFFNGLLMLLFHFVCELLPNLWKQYIEAMPAKVFCLWLLAWKYHLIHPLFIDVNIVFLSVFWPIHGCARSGYTAQLMLLSVVFLTTIISGNVCGFFLIP